MIYYTPTIAFDFDGTLFDLMTVWTSTYNQETNSNVKPEHIRDWYAPGYMTKWDVSTHIDLISNPRLYDDVKPYPGAVDFVKFIKFQMKWNVLFVSHCLNVPGMAHTKVNKLREHGLLHNADDFIPISGENRLLLNLDALIEDKPQMCQDNGIVWLVDRPWTENVECPKRIPHDFQPLGEVVANLIRAL